MSRHNDVFALGLELSEHKHVLAIGLARNFGSLPAGKAAS